MDPLAGRIIPIMVSGRDRVLCVSLSDEEWRAFVMRHPDPVDWLRERILHEIAKWQDVDRDEAPHGSSARPADTKG